MANDKTTFIKFLSEYAIEIPRIQRDYVQGRAATVEQKEKRKDFVKNLVDAISSDAHPCVLDFVYGFTTGEGDVRTFIPLDGQQRLTSLYLLHWYLLHLIANKRSNEDLQFDVEGKMRMLNGRFKYNNRNSSTEFCQRLTSKDEFLDIEGVDEIRQAIMQQPWLDEEWIFDPTIGTMLDMLLVYESFLKDKNYDDVVAMAERLFCTESVYFDKLSLEDLHQGESLYVKMNARGKKLTRFENWKAKFTKMLEDYHKGEDFTEGDAKRCNSKTYKDYFCYSIEHEWNDLFWHFVTKDIQWDSKDDVLKRDYPTVDRAFSNFLRFIHQILYFYDRNDYKAKIGDFQWTFAQNEETYGRGKTENLTFLFESLDFLAHIDSCYKNASSAGLDAFFDDIFYTKGNNGDSWVDHKVRIAIDHPNLFEKAVGFYNDDKKKLVIDNLEESSKFNLTEMYLLWAILRYCAPRYCSNRQQFVVDDALRYYVRDSRNKLDAIDQFLTGTVTLSTNLKLIDAYPTIAKLPASKAARYTVKGLQELYEWLDDFDYLYEGNSMSNNAYLPILDKIEAGNTNITVQQVKDFANAFEDSTTIDRIKLLIGVGYKGKTGIGATGDNRERYFFGQKNRWNVFFVEDAAILAPLLETLILDYSKHQDVRRQIDSYRQNATVNTFAYYMLNYDYALWGQNDCTNLCTDDGFAFFAVSGSLDDMDILSLRSISNQPLSAYHIDPLVCAVVNQSICHCPQLMSHVQVSGRFSAKQGIAIPNPAQSDNFDFKMISNKNGWTIETDKIGLLSAITSNNTNIKYNNDIFELYGNNIKETDKVWIGKAILEEIIKIHKW